MFAVWRGWVGERQSITALRQAETAQRSLLNERYQRGADMLGSDVLAVRLGGIYALQRLAEENPGQYHIIIMQLFCAFVVQASKEGGDNTSNQPMQMDIADHRFVMAAPDSTIPLRIDVQDAMEAIRARSKEGIDIERKSMFRLGLSSANLIGVRLMGADLSWAVLTDADLSGSMLTHTNLSSAWLDGANLSGADLWSANLSRTVLVRPRTPTGLPEKLDRRPVTGLTQEELDEAHADPTRPPDLDGVLDAETGEPLVWRGAPVDDAQ